MLTLAHPATSPLALLNEIWFRQLSPSEIIVPYKIEPSRFTSPRWNKSHSKVAWHCYTFGRYIYTRPMAALRLTLERDGLKKRWFASKTFTSMASFLAKAGEACSVQAHCLSGGWLRIDGTVSDNLIPIQLDVKGDIELTLEWSGGIVHVHGNSASLELIGTAEYVEEFRSRE